MAWPGEQGLETREMPVARCLGCDYDVRGLDAAGHCPECGLPLWRSVERPLLRYAEPAWVERLALGTMLVSLSFPVALLWGWLIVGIAQVQGQPWPVGPGWSLAAWFVPALTAVVGFWLMTSRDPEQAVARFPVGRHAVRIVALACFLGTGVLIAIPEQAPALMPRPVVVDWRGLAATLVLFAMPLAGGLWAAHLARRLPEPTLARDIRRATATWCAMLLWLGLVGIVGRIVFGQTVINATGTRPWGVLSIDHWLIAVAAMVPAVLIGVVVFLWALSLVVELIGSIKGEAMLAQQGVKPGR